MILLMQWFADKESRLSQANITSIKSENDNYIIHIKDFNHEYIYTLQVWGNHVRLIRKEEYATIA